MLPRIRFLDKENHATKIRVVKALRHITRPLTREELDKALEPYLLKSHRRAAVDALASLEVFAVVYRDDDTARD